MKLNSSLKIISTLISLGIPYNNLIEDNQNYLNSYKHPTIIKIEISDYDKKIDEIQYSIKTESIKQEFLTWRMDSGIFEERMLFYDVKLKKTYKELQKLHKELNLMNKKKDSLINLL